MELDLRLGAAVYCAQSAAAAGKGNPGEDYIGTLTRVLVDDSGAVEDLVVRLDAGLTVDEVLADSPEVRIPADRVLETTERWLLIQATADDIDIFPDYLEERAPTESDHWAPPP